MIKNPRKGILLAGGQGTRLIPLTQSINKHLLPIYDKPMIYYSLSVILMAGIRDILLITTEESVALYKKILGDGSHWGITIQYKIQEQANGIAEALILGEEFLDGSPVMLMLGDNIIHGSGIVQKLRNISEQDTSTIFAYRIADPNGYGIVDFDAQGTVLSIEEKPQNPKTHYAVIGIYFYDEQAPQKAKTLKPSARGELEITDLNNLYRQEKKLKVDILGRGIAWLDTGTVDNLIAAAQYVQTIEQRQGIKICCPEELAYKNGWLNKEQVLQLAKKYAKSAYGAYLSQIVTEKSI